MGRSAPSPVVEVAPKASLDAVNQAFDLHTSTKPKDRIFTIMENFKNTNLYKMPSDVNRAVESELYDGASLIIHHLMTESSKAEEAHKEVQERCDNIKKRLVDVSASRDATQKDLVLEKELHLASRRDSESEISKLKLASKQQMNKFEKEKQLLESRIETDKNIIQELKFELEMSREASIRDAELTADLMLTMADKDARIAELVEYIPRMTAITAQLSCLSKANIILRESLRDATARIRNSCSTRGGVLDSVKASLDRVTSELEVIMKAADSYKLASIKNQVDEDKNKIRVRRKVRILPLPKDLRKARLKVANEQLDFFKKSAEAASAYNEYMMNVDEGFVSTSSPANPIGMRPGTSHFEPPSSHFSSKTAASNSTKSPKRVFGGSNLNGNDTLDSSTSEQQTAKTPLSPNGGRLPLSTKHHPSISPKSVFNQPSMGKSFKSETGMTAATTVGTRRNVSSPSSNQFMSSQTKFSSSLKKTGTRTLSYEEEEEAPDPSDAPFLNGCEQAIDVNGKPTSTTPFQHNQPPPVSSGQIDTDPNNFNVSPNAKRRGAYR